MKPAPPRMPVWVIHGDPVSRRNRGVFVVSLLATLGTAWATGRVEAWAFLPAVLFGAFFMWLYRTAVWTLPAAPNSTVDEARGTVSQNGLTYRLADIIDVTTEEETETKHSRHGVTVLRQWVVVARLVGGTRLRLQVALGRPQAGKVADRVARAAGAASTRG